MSAIHSTDRVSVIALTTAVMGVLVYPLILFLGTTSSEVIRQNSPLLEFAGSLILLLAIGAGLMMPIALVCGFIALRRIKKSELPTHGRSLSWLAIIISGGYILLHTFLS